MSGEIDFRFRLKLKITLVESTYPSQHPECPSLSPHFLLIGINSPFPRYFKRNDDWETLAPERGYGKYTSNMVAKLGDVPICRSYSGKVVNG